ncbi:hypothetical protein [Novosphingobium sp.]|uniref:hypothetical protein n=1 Tax=Novosphingobium sp. TaxID=1874826 RepID=UPI0035B20B06
MAQQSLRKEEALGLAVAIAAHAGLVAFLLLKPPAPPAPRPERITVTLSDEVGLTSAAPSPAADAAPDTGPEVGEPAPEPSPAPPPPKPEPQVVPKPQPTAVPAPQPKPQPKPQPTVAAKPVVPVKPVVKPAPVKPAPAKPVAAPARPTAAAPAAKPAAKPGASRFADAFNKGIPGATGKTPTQNPPAATIGPAVRSALAGAISRQLKPKWVAPQGMEAEKLVTILAWDLNPDGTLAGSPRVVRQDGITEANRAQAQRHAEQAVRAVRLAAPFNLPSEYYPAWKRIAEFRFDRRLSQ